MGPDRRPEIRMELAEYLSSQLAGDGSHDLFELASSDPQMFFTELLSRHRSGELALPDHLVRSIARDFAEHRSTSE